MKKTSAFKWPHWCSIARFWRFSNVRLFQLYGTDYIVSPIGLQRKRTFEKLSTCKWTTNSLISKYFEFKLWPLKRSIALQLYGTDYNSKIGLSFFCLHAFSRQVLSDLLIASGRWELELPTCAQQTKSELVQNIAAIKSNMRSNTLVAFLIISFCVLNLLPESCDCYPSYYYPTGRYYTSYYPYYHPPGKQGTILTHKL